MQNTASIESINTSHPFFHQLSAGNRHCVGGWEAGEVEADVHWCGGDGEKGVRGREVRELKYSKWTDNIHAIILDVLFFF